MGKCCIVGCRDAEIVVGEEAVLRFGSRVFREGDWLSLDGGTGEVFSGSIEKTSPELGQEYETLMRWIDRFLRFMSSRTLIHLTKSRPLLRLGQVESACAERSIYSLPTNAPWPYRK